MEIRRGLRAFRGTRARRPPRQVVRPGALKKDERMETHRGAPFLRTGLRFDAGTIPADSGAAVTAADQEADYSLLF